MTFFISGGAKCGKSTLAQDLTVALSEDGKRYYVATMISSGKDSSFESIGQIFFHWFIEEGLPKSHFWAIIFFDKPLQ